MNAGFPPDADARWQLIEIKKFDRADDAHDAESRLLDDLEKKERRLGGEFAWIPEREVTT